MTQPESPIAVTPTISAGKALAEIINLAWEELDLPEVVFRIAPEINESTGLERTPVAFVCPISHQVERSARGLYEHEFELALVLAVRGDQMIAENAMSAMLAALLAALDAGRLAGCGVLRADFADLYDYTLMAQHNIFRSQLNVLCSYHQSR